MSLMSANTRKKKNDLILFPVLLVLLVIVFQILTSGKFLVASNMVALLSHAVIPTFIVWGMCFIFTAGVMDLSIGAIVILASNVGGLLALKFGYVGLILGSVVTAVVLELINLVLCTRTKIPSWVIGLGMAMVYEAIGALYSVSQIRQGLQVVTLGTQCRSLGMFPVNIFIWVAGGLVAWMLFNRSSVGINVRAVGGNAQVAGMMGVSPRRAVITGGIVGGVFFGIAAAINESYAGRVMPVTGLSSIAIVFTPLAVLLLAQAFEKIVSLPLGVMLSAILFFSLYNVLTIMGVPSGTWQDVVLGASIVVFGIFSQRNSKGVVK